MANNTQTGLKKETLGALAYLIGPISGFVLLVLEKDEFVRFHSMQSIVVFGALIVTQWVLAATVVLSVLIPLTTLVGFILWLTLMYKAVQGEKWEVPVLSKYVHKFLK